MDFLLIAVIVAVCGALYVMYDKFVLEKKRRLKGNYVRIILFESVGKDKSFRGVFKGVEKTDDVLGVYILIGKIKKAISNVSADDFFHDNEFGRALIVCKFTEDDYRVISSLKNELWFKMKDEKTKTGETTYQEYFEPLGITSDGRTASRFNRSFNNRMRELRQEKQGFFDKYAPYIMLSGMLLIILISTAYNSNKFELASENMAEVFADKANGYLAAVENPGFAEKLLERLERGNVESQTPLS